MRVLVLGLDGATFDLIKPWAEAGYLPAMAQMLRDGVHGELTSTIPALSPPAWVSFMTGKNPGKHGVFDFMQRRPASYSIQSVRPNWAKTPSIFGLVSRAGKQVGVMNVPMTYPPEPVNGFLISGLGTPSSGCYTYPPEFGVELATAGYPLYVPVACAPGQEDRYLDELCQITENRARVALELMKSKKWELFMVVFRSPDEVATFFWHHMDETHPLHNPRASQRYKGAILHCYEQVDDILQRLLTNADQDTIIIVMSDHGAGPLHKEVNLNLWLAQEGFLALRQRRIGMNGKSLVRSFGLTKEKLASLFGSTTLRKLQRLVPSSLRSVVPSAYPDLSEMISWPQTKAYSMGFIGQIYVNLAGREPLGTVQPGEEYERVVAELTERLYSLRDPATGEKVVDVVFRREDVYHGPCQSEAPDLNVIMRNMSYITRTDREFVHKAVFALPTNWTGTHRMKGIFMAKGPGLRRGESVQGAKLVDLAPTILYLLGIPIPSDMDGRVLEEVLDLSLPRPNEPMYIDPPAGNEIPDNWSVEDEQDVIDRLRGLGYLN